jgi:hypothetical protein
MFIDEKGGHGTEGGSGIQAEGNNVYKDMEVIY